MSDSLFDAIRNNDENTVSDLLKSNPELVGSRDQRGSTPLLLSTYFGLKEITHIILKYPQDLNAQDASGNTALMGVCFKGFEEIAEKLIKAGADVNTRNFNGGDCTYFCC